MKWVNVIAAIVIGAKLADGAANMANMANRNKSIREDVFLEEGQALKSKLKQKDSALRSALGYLREYGTEDGELTGDAKRVVEEIERAL